MKTIEKLLCETMHDFVKEHLDNLSEDYDIIGFEDEKDMLTQIQNDTQVAAWSLVELCSWGFRKNFQKINLAYDHFIQDVYFDENDDEVTIYKLHYCNTERYVRILSDEKYNYEIKEVKPITKMVEVTVWE